ncbi:MAG: hypothetical protein IT249_08100 [Chitinophagaceae bacterium]|nr:hypothetical protein [Chitinophagaceae bacterium]
MPKKSSAVIEIIGINPFVFVTDKILASIFTLCGKDKDQGFGFKKNLR